MQGNVYESSLLGHKLKGKIKKDTNNFYECFMHREDSNL